MWLSGLNYLSKQNNCNIHSQVLPNGIIQSNECDSQEKSMKIMIGSQYTSELNEIQLFKLQKGDIIDMNEKEERWEVDSLNHIPFGYGCIYESRNHLLFNVFMFKRIKLCFGTIFFGDVGIVEFELNFYWN